jgi:uncharacterized YigZ family protein
LKKEEYQVIIKEGYGEVIKRRSRFIARLCSVESVEHAERIIKETKKKYYDARHTCYAYIIEETPQILRFNDDGEPSGTAGKPMLDVLLGKELTNVLVLCTRYFGGTLLGTGGLVRAYQGAAKDSLMHAIVGTSKVGRKLKIISNYEDNGKIQYLMEQKGWNIEHTEYMENVKNYVCLPVGEIEELKKKVTEKTAARAKIIELETVSIIEKT